VQRRADERVQDRPFTALQLATCEHAEAAIGPPIFEGPALPRKRVTRPRVPCHVCKTLTLGLTQEHLVAELQS